MTPFILELQNKEPLAVFSALKHLPYSLWLDSADLGHEAGRYSFIASHPIETIEAKDGQVTLTNWDTQEKRKGDPFAIVQERLAHWRPDIRTIRGLPPFQGGAAGFFGYDLARGLEDLPETAQSAPDMPDMAVGIYDQVIAFDHRKHEAWLFTHAANYTEARRKQDYLLSLIAHPFKPEPFTGTDITWTPRITASAYKTHVEKTIEYIKAGDIFQANLSQRFDADLPDDFDPFAHYLRLRHVNPAPFAGYMNCGGITIASASPERFLSLRDRMVETKPIKGTRRRSKNVETDHLAKKDLSQSEKDRAENTMIVDLLRNDLSKVCTPESVNVFELCKLETFASVHHLVSTVRGTLAEEKTPRDLLRACFPGGSITGAPKIRAMEIIEELEPTRRGPYCGAMGYVGFDGTMDSNILIRTLVYEGKQVSLQVGGGITADSDAEAEYQETLDKAAALFNSFKPLPERNDGPDVTVDDLLLVG